MVEVAEIMWVRDGCGLILLNSDYRQKLRKRMMKQIERMSHPSLNHVSLEKKPGSFMQ